eukprot:TRINITY_DN772_c2_g2_i2.p1 TRINITY_DN772_c2_g2~~TRINITY_DN772_c2_g2_i2.p1  ORF type:complete len:426 (+),score=168.06 TRINITY_DN772_c2_g2_i2:181-1458(+)
MNQSKVSSGDFKNAILFIPNGFGFGTHSFSREILASNLLTFKPDSLLIGSLQTKSSSNNIPDTAAAATSLATGIKNANSLVSITETGVILTTILELGRQNNYITGIVSSTSLLDTSVAAFYAHSKNKTDQSFFADQLLNSNISVMFGGGKNILKSKEDEFITKGYSWIETEQELEQTTAPVIGVFSDENLPFEIDRNSDNIPSLNQMVIKAKELLSDITNKNGDITGYILIVFAGLFSEAADNRDLASTYHESISFNDALNSVLNFSNSNEKVKDLIIAASGYETSGLTLARILYNGTICSNYYPSVVSKIKKSVDFMSTEINKGFDPRTVIFDYTSIEITNLEEELLLNTTNQQELNLLIGEMICERACISFDSIGITGNDVPLYVYTTKPLICSIDDNDDEIKLFANIDNSQVANYVKCALSL